MKRRGVVRLPIRSGGKARGDLHAVSLGKKKSHLPTRERGEMGKTHNNGLEGEGEAMAGRGMARKKDLAATKRSSKKSGVP